METLIKVYRCNLCTEVYTEDAVAWLEKYSGTCYCGNETTQFELEFVSPDKFNELLTHGNLITKQELEEDYI